MAIIYHGTSKYFERVDLQAAARVEGRHGMDEWGTGFYTAINDDPAKAADYAQTYAGSNGMVLQGSMDDNAVSFLNTENALGEAGAQRLQQALDQKIADPQTPDLVRSYYQHINGQISPDTNGNDVWRMLSSEGALEQHAMTSAASPPENSAIRAMLREDMQGLFEEDMWLADMQDFTDEQRASFKQGMTELAEKPGILQPFYQSLVQDEAKMFASKSYEVRIISGSIASHGQQSVLASLDAQGPVMDIHATHILNNAGYDGIHIPSQDTLVWKGSGADKVPDMHVTNIIGDGPANAPVDLKSGDLAIRSAMVGAPHADAPNALKNIAESLGDSAKHGGIVSGVVGGTAAGGLMFAATGSAAQAGEMAVAAAVPYGEAAMHIAQGNLAAAERAAVIESWSNVGAVAGGVGGMAIGGGVGFTAGTVVPVAGNAAGGAMGAAAGGFLGAEIGSQTGALAGQVYYDYGRPVADAVEAGATVVADGVVWGAQGIADGAVGAWNGFTSIFNQESGAAESLPESAPQNDHASVNEWTRVNSPAQFGGYDFASNGSFGSSLNIQIGNDPMRGMLSSGIYNPTLLADAHAIKGRMIEPIPVVPQVSFAPRSGMGFDF